MSLLKEISPALIIILILVIGGSVYLMIPGRLNGPVSSRTGTSTIVIATTTIIGTTTSSDLQSSPTDDNTFEQTGS